MATDERKRQQKLAKRAAKQKERKKQLRAQNPASLVGQLRPFAGAPVLHSYYCDTLLTNGIGDAVICRLRGTEVAFAHFLLDVYCLGVKDVHVGLLPRASYEERLNRPIRERFQVIDTSPACLRKLVEGSVAYARQFGLPPHSDYPKAAVLFGYAEAAQCDTEFAYGRDGKPFFIPGPSDDAHKISRVMKAISAHGGDFIIPVTPHSEDCDIVDSDFEDDDALGDPPKIGDNG